VIHINANELVNYAYDNNKVRLILNHLECYGITKKEKEWRCGLPKDNNKSRIRIKNNKYLNITIFQSNDEVIRGNIITLTMFIKNISFPEANKYIHKILGLKYYYNKNIKIKNIKSPVDIFKQKKRRKIQLDISTIDIKDDKILKEFTPNLHISWLREGILSFTARKFNIGYDYRKKSITIPERLWSGDENEYVGMMGRTTIDDATCDMLDISKYYAIIPYLKSLNLYGLQENYEEIQKAGKVIVHEAQKSVLKRHSRLDPTGVAIGSHDISSEQVKILIGLNVEIIICFDKGVSIHHIRRMCENFYKIRKVSYVWDKYNLLDDKEAPADKNNKIYNYLLENKILYDIKEHYKYINKEKIKEKANEKNWNRNRSD
jgi:hypothetical protein